MSEKVLTKNRQAVLDVLNRHHEALSAYDILDTLHAQDSKWKPATVYRALNYLIETELIHRVESEQKFISCGHKHQSHEEYFLICNHCGHISEKKLGEELVSLFSELASKSDFKLEAPYLEFRGVCKQCLGQ